MIWVENLGVGADNLSSLRFFKALGIMSLSLHLWSKSWFEVCIFLLILSSKSGRIVGKDTGEFGVPKRDPAA